MATQRANGVWDVFMSTIRRGYQKPVMLSWLILQFHCPSFGSNLRGFAGALYT